MTNVLATLSVGLLIVLLLQHYLKMTDITSEKQEDAEHLSGESRPGIINRIMIELGLRE